MALRSGSLLVSLVIACAGCKDGGEPSPGVYSGPANTCRTRADCDRGVTCDKEHAMCVRKDDLTETRYLARVKPENGEADLFRVSLEEDRLMLVLKQRVPVTVAPYTVVANELPDGGVEEEEVPVTFEGRIVVKDLRGAELRQGAPSSTKQSTSSATFSLSPGSERYAFELLPKGATAEEYPPQYLDDVTIEAVARDSDSGGDTEAEESALPFQVFPKTDTLAGEIRRKGGQQSFQPLDGLTVEAFDPETGRILSTQTRTRCNDTAPPSAICGEFDLGLRSSEPPYHLRFYRAEEPRYPVVVFSDLDVPVIGGRSVFTIENPLPAPILYNAKVERPVTYDGLADCRVFFESVEPIGGGDVTIAAFTDQTGVATAIVGDEETAARGIHIYPGVYAITVVPPEVLPGATVDFASYREVKEIQRPEDGESVSSLDLSYRTRVEVRVTAGGEPVPAASLESEPLDSGSPYPRRSRSFFDGDQHVLFLDPGKHRLTVRLPVQSGYAFSFRTVEIGAGVEVGSGVETEANRKPAREPVTLRLKDIEGTIPNVLDLLVTAEEPSVDVAGAEIEWYQIIADTHAVLVARTATDEKGRAQVLIPPPDALADE